MQSIKQVAQCFRSLKFNNLANSLEELLKKAEEQQQSYLQFAAAMVENEIQLRTKRRLELNNKRAEFPVTKHLEEFDYHHQTTINKRQINQLLDCSFVDNRQINSVFFSVR